MKKLVLVLFIFSSILYSQQKNLITISSNASIVVPAEKIVFTIRLNYENENPKELFKYHKAQEHKLVELLKSFGVEDENITYDLLRLTPYKDYKERETIYKSYQEVRVKLDNPKLYEEFQVKLLSNDIENFSSQFTSDKSDDIEDKLLVKAIKKAKEKAGKIAQAAGITLGKIVSINTNSGDIHPMPLRAEMDAGFMAKSALSNIPQKVEFRTFVTIQFEIK